MSNGLHQIHAGYDPAQDRILFSLKTQDGSEYRFWVTRRYLLLLWSMLARLATMFADARANGDPLMREALGELAHHQAQKDADFRTAYVEGENRPLGDEPLLLAKVSLGRNPQGALSLSLLPDSGQGADIGMDENVTHLIAGLLQKAAISAGWQVTLAPLTPPPMGETAASSSVH